MMRERFMPHQLPETSPRNLARNFPRGFPDTRQDIAKTFTKRPPKTGKRRAATGQATVPEFHQLNVKAWLMRRIQIALITRYAAVAGPVEPAAELPSVASPRAHPDWMESRCALDSFVLCMSLSENRCPLFRDMH
jgi:hypothetical protein